MNGPAYRIAIRLPKWWGVVAVLACTACASQGPSGNPIVQGLSWFTYASGADVRDRCTAGSPDTYRFVYNGQYERHLRAYDLSVKPDGSSEILARARGTRGNLARFQLNNPLGPWALEEQRATIDRETTDGLLAALAVDATAVPPAGGQRLNSYEFYWLVSACRQGQFGLAAFVHPRVNHQGLTFPAQLLAVDATSVPFRKARAFEGGRRDSFQLKINRAGDGLAGPVVAF